MFVSIAVIYTVSNTAMHFCIKYMSGRILKELECDKHTVKRNSSKCQTQVHDLADCKFFRISVGSTVQLCSVVSFIIGAEC